MVDVSAEILKGSLILPCSKPVASIGRIDREGAVFFFLNTEVTHENMIGSSVYWTNRSRQNVF